VVASRIGTGGALVTLGLVIVALVVWRVRRRRAEQASAESEPASAESEQASAESEPDPVTGDEDVPGEARRRS
jgi:hypothetical protein